MLLINFFYSNINSSERVEGKVRMSDDAHYIILREGKFGLQNLEQVMIKIIIEITTKAIKH